MSDLDLTLGAVERHRWRCLLLQSRSKEPISLAGHHHVTTSSEVIRRHVGGGGNVGIFAGTHVVLDFDVEDRVRCGMGEHLGPLCGTVRTGGVVMTSSGGQVGKVHTYVAAVSGVELAQQMYWRGVNVGQVKRLRSEYVVAPPSIHPDTGRVYTWFGDPNEPLQELTPEWIAHLAKEPKTIAPHGAWDGPDPEEMQRRARRQPGAAERGGKVTFQCPGCAAEGRDGRGREHAVLFDDGRFTCVVDETHRGAIAVALGTTIAEAGLRGVAGLRGLRGL